jgi:2,4-dienoyl-CoA reductase-like NADH-dependent reductase (Old Yellow Enzyme family)
MLETPITFHHSGKTADNRIMKSAMTERLCLWDDDLAASDARGTPTPEYLKLYEEWGKGGMGE